MKLLNITEKAVPCHVKYGRRVKNDWYKRTELVEGLPLPSLPPPKDE